ncbi:FAD-dependent oxidoreductase [Agrilactobacillus fermenti]|uniref:FAD-dependent oxidoreductase n=1 Tax=Agrilactobacillus fermenti TaxID=2586909 RepID=UPI003A5C53B4
MKVIVIGCTHAGTAAVTQIYKTDPEAQVTVYERNDNVSFLSCGIALHLEGVVKDPQGLFYSSPEQLAELGANVQMKHDVLAVDTDAKSVQVKDLTTGTVTTDTYDKLVLTTGSWPIIPPIDGIDSQRVMLCKNWNHAQALFQQITDAKKRVVIIGGGYIGTELVEAFKNTGHEVTLIDSLPRILNKYLDQPFTDRVEADFEAHGVHLALNQTVQAFTETKTGVQVKTDQQTFDADIAVMSVGFRPMTDLLKGKAEMLANGALIVDDYMRTSLPDVFAAGDSVAVHYNPTGENNYVPLATNAVRQGMLVGLNIEKPTLKYIGTQSSSGLKLFGTTIASTGLTKESAQHFGLDAESVLFEDNYRPEFMPSTEPVLMSLVWEKASHRIIGGQLMSRYDVSQSANTLSVAIQKQMTIEELAFVDMLFQPHFDRPWHYLNLLAQQAMAKANQPVPES